MKHLYRLFLALWLAAAASAQTSGGACTSYSSSQLQGPIAIVGSNVFICVPTSHPGLAGTWLEMVPAPSVQTGAVTSAGIASGAVTSAAIASGAVTSAGIASGAITSAGIASGAVTSAGLASGAVTAPALGAGAVGSAALAPNTGFGLTAQQVCHAQYSFANDGGADAVITPANNCTLPNKAVITNVAINATTTVTSGGAATIAVGTSAGSSGASFLAATTYADFAAGDFVQGVPVPDTASTWVKLSAAGQVTITPATATLTAGVIEIYVFYYVSST